jgi:hypothetical protein
VTCPSYVRATCVNSRHVPTFMAGKQGLSPWKTGRGLFSEGRGHRFESCRVRHNFKDLRDIRTPAKQGVSELCPSHPALFPARSPAQWDGRRMAETRNGARGVARPARSCEAGCALTPFDFGEPFWRVK